ncbi:MAG: Rho termination factor N-terminal domain-containing protein [Candidatus Izimaplasma sp.]|nr:Rho termination factor N-terminal domain-containing protein [Candidatus Izimaplasma bacterium]
MFSSFAKGNILVIFITVLILLTGIIYLQAGLSRLAKKKENNIEKEQTTKQEIKEAKKETKEHPKKNENLQQDEPKATGSIPTMNQLTAMTVAELKTLAKNRNLEGYSQLNKKSLIEKVKSSYKN